MFPGKGYLLKRLKLCKSKPILSVNSDKGLLREPSEFLILKLLIKDPGEGLQKLFLLRNSFGQTKRDLQHDLQIPFKFFYKNERAILPLPSAFASFLFCPLWLALLPSSAYPFLPWALLPLL